MRSLLSEGRHFRGIATFGIYYRERKPVLRPTKRPIGSETIAFSHTNPYISNITQRCHVSSLGHLCLHEFFSLPLPVPDTVNPLFSPPSQISPTLSNRLPPPFQRSKVNKPPPSLLSPPLSLPQSLFFTKKLTINVD